MSQDGQDHQDTVAAATPRPASSSNSGRNDGRSKAAGSPADAETTKGKDVAGEQQEGGVPSSGGSKSSSDGADRTDAVAGTGAAAGSSQTEHEMHIWTERERRKKMRCMFANLHALLPHLPPKTDKASIVEEAVNCIKTLQVTLEKLQKQKLDRAHALHTNADATEASPSSLPPSWHRPAAPATRESVLADMAHAWNAQEAGSFNAMPAAAVTTPLGFQTWSAPNIVLSVAGGDAYISVCTPRQPGILTTVVFVLDKHQIEVVSAQVSSDRSRSMFMIHARVSGDRLGQANGAPGQCNDKLMPEEIYKLAVSEMMLWLSN